MLPYYRSDREYESNLSESRIQVGLTIKELCKQAGVKQTSAYSGLNSGLKSPILKNGSVNPDARKLADFLSMELSDLWPRYFCSISEHVELSPDQIVEHFHRGLLSPEFADPELQFLEKERLVELNEAALGLRDREIVVIGMKIFDEMTFDDISEQLNVSKGWTAQIFHTAIRKLEKIFTKLKILDSQGEWLA